jgi:putative DNA primase/helicase
MTGLSRVDDQPDDLKDIGPAFAALADAMENDGIDLSPVSPHPHVEGGSPEKEFAGEEDAPFDDGCVPPAPPPDVTVSPEALQDCVAQPLNDTGNGKRLLLHYGDDVLHVRDVGWHTWSGTHWHREGGDEAVVGRAQLVAALIVLEADLLAATPRERALIEAADSAHAQLDDLGKIDELTPEQEQSMDALERAIRAGEFARGELTKRQNKRRAFAVSSGNTSRITGMIAQALPHRTVKPDALDVDPVAINLENGTLNFVRAMVDDPDASELTGYKKTIWRPELRGHDRGDLISKLSPVVYDAEAQCPAFMAFLDRFQPNLAIRKFLQVYHGYAMTGLTGEQCLAFSHGLGANGKSTFVEIICRIMGDYALTLSFESLAGENGRRGDQASPDLARLPGARMVRASEPERGVNFKESLLKSLTGGEPMLVRHLHKGFFEFRPAFKLVLSGNHKPDISGVDHGIWRRMRLVPWEVTIAESDRRPIEDVLAEFWQERSGILNWLIEGTRLYLTEGLIVPAEIATATSDYREEMDPVGGFVADCVEGVPMLDGVVVAVVLAREMYEAFESWCAANSVRAWKEKSFATVMLDKGFVRKREASGRKYLNVRLHDVPPRPKRNVNEEPPHPADDEVAR